MGAARCRQPIAERQQVGRHRAERADLLGGLPLRSRREQTGDHRPLVHIRPQQRADTISIALAPFVHPALIFIAGRHGRDGRACMSCARKKLVCVLGPAARNPQQTDRRQTVAPVGHAGQTHLRARSASVTPTTLQAISPQQHTAAATAPRRRLCHHFHAAVAPRRGMSGSPERSARDRQSGAMNCAPTEASASDVRKVSRSPAWPILGILLTLSPPDASAPSHLRRLAPLCVAGRRRRIGAGRRDRGVAVFRRRARDQIAPISAAGRSARSRRS